MPLAAVYRVAKVHPTVGTSTQTGSSHYCVSVVTWGGLIARSGTLCLEDGMPSQRAQKYNCDLLPCLYRWPRLCVTVDPAWCLRCCADCCHWRQCAIGMCLFLQARTHPRTLDPSWLPPSVSEESMSLLSLTWEQMGNYGVLWRTQRPSWPSTGSHHPAAS